MFNGLRPVSVGRIYPNVNILDRSRVSFQSLHDTFELQTLEKFFSESFIKKVIDANPQLKRLVQKFNPEMRLNMQELKELQLNHCKETQEIAKEIAENLPLGMQNQIDKKALYEAAYLHDVGKVLIPDNILNKPDKLTFQERVIMDMHSLIGFELLKNSGLNSRTLNLIKNHHKKFSKLEKMFAKNPDYTLQILSTADKYSALLEKRVYKEPLEPKEALTIIYRDVKSDDLGVKSGDLDERIFNVLVKYSQNNENLKYLSIN